MTHPDTPSEDTTEQLPEHTTPTWEVELLISGAAVFAMLQLPGWLSTHLLPLMPRFTLNTGAAISMLYAYLAGAAVILAITFALHLTMRAYWIALVGMHSVFPDGVRWENIRIGQTARHILQQRGDDAAVSIEHADNRATVVFAFGVMLAMTMLWLSLTVVVAIGLSVAITLISHHQIDTTLVFAAMVVLILAPLVLAMLVDRNADRPRRPDGILQRLLSRVFTTYARAGFLRGFSVSRVLEGHIGSRRFRWLSMIVTLLVTVGIAANVAIWNSPTQLGNYAWFPHFTAPSLHVITASHYDDQRNPQHDRPAPFIQSEVIAGPYVKLVVPYSPERDGASLRNTCPALHLADTDDTRANAALACLTALHRVWLDGKRLTTLQYEVGSDPRTHRPTLQAMIDIRALAPGRHTLRVARAPPRPEHRPWHDTAKVWSITFWH